MQKNTLWKLDHLGMDDGELRAVHVTFTPVIFSKCRGRGRRGFYSSGVNNSLLKSNSGTPAKGFRCRTQLQVCVCSTWLAGWLDGWVEAVTLPGPVFADSSSILTLFCNPGCDLDFFPHSLIFLQAQKARSESI